MALVERDRRIHGAGFDDTDSIQPDETNCWDREDYYDNETWDVGSSIKLTSRT